MRNAESHEKRGAGAYKYYDLFCTGDRVISKEYILKTDNMSEPVSSFDGKKWKVQVHYFESNVVG